MANAKLVITKPKRFSHDIWQYEGNFTEKQWKETLEDFADNLQGIYDFLCTTDEYGAGCIELYGLGDVINMLRNIDVEA